MCGRLGSMIAFLLLVTVGASPITCRGWGGEERVISPERINDGYCDCPLDGADEPNTEACAGSRSWPGIPDANHESSSQPVFQCPQQPKLQLPLSRINDGICDCCDGSDEETMDCPDICDELLAEERAALAKIKEAFTIGYEKRQLELKEFEILRQETLKEIQLKKKQLEQVQGVETETQADLDEAKREYVLQRIDLVKGIRKDMNALVEPLSEDELFAIIVQTCQLSGEQESQKGTTCAPLRLAGMDIGIVWENENLEKGTATVRKILKEDPKGFQTVANLMDKHARGEDLNWSMASGTETKEGAHKKRQARRAHYDDDEEDEDEYYDNDDYYPEDDDFVDYDESSSGTPSPEGEADVNESDAIQQEVRASHLSKFRVRFLQHADELIGKIDDISHNERDSEEEDEEEKETDDGSKPTGGDPMAMQMVRNTLKRKKESIERGFKFAASASVLLRALNDQAGEDSEEARRWLSDLAVGTIGYGNVRAQDVWQLLVMNIAEFGYKAIDDAEETCVNDVDSGVCLAPETAAFKDHMAYICPERVIESRNVPFPPESIVNAARSLCQDWSANPPDIVCPFSTAAELPSDIPDGYCGYFTIQPRDSSEVFSNVFAPLTSLGRSSKISELDGKLQSLQEKSKDLDKELSELYDKIGGKKQNKFGNDGELHSLREECPSVEAGKYIYEVCFFGKASQRDRDEGKGRGTDLGHWKGMTVDEETGERTMKWEGGAKCWNGPQRSATVHVTCGTETRVLSAEEPDTCRYVLEMESHIACDDLYKERFGL